MSEIYTVTSLFLKIREGKVEIDKFDSRCFGFFFKLDDAIEAVAYNRCNMQECYYNYLVIEEFKEGIHPIAKEVEWFGWNSEENSWKACSKPEEIDNVFNYGIG